MATAKEKTDIAYLQRDVAVIKNDIGYMKKSQEELTDIVKGMAFVPIKDFDDLTKRVDSLEKYNFDNRLGTVFAQLLSNKIFTVFAGLLVAAAIYYAVKTGAIK